MKQLSATLYWRRHAVQALLVMSGLALAWPRAALAVTDLPRGVAAPPLALKDQNGTEVTNAALRGHIAVLVFGEFYHDTTRQACAQVDSVLQDPRLAGLPLVSVLIVTQERQEGAALERLPARVARDPDRAAFGAYHVVVMPSLVVLDQQGRVVHTVAGAIPRLADLITDALLYAGGKLSAAAFERSAGAPSEPLPTDPAELHASRLALLGRQLLRRGLDEMAAEKLREALQLDPKSAIAHEELGRLLLKQSRLPEAEAEFSAVLAVNPESVDAALGLAFVHTLRADGDLVAAEKAVRAVLARRPMLPRAHYLLGVVQERNHKTDEAAACFKKAAEFLLDRPEQE